MEKPLSITAHDFDLTAPVEALIRKRAVQLERFFPDVVSCSVIVHGPGRHHRTGAPFKVQVDVRVPGYDPLVVNRQSSADVRVAIRSAFDAIRRQLEETARVRRVEVKRHEPPTVGRVARLFAEQGYGFIETLDQPSRELYFHRNSLPEDDFDALRPGQKVRFHEERGEKGPQASTVVVQG